MTNRQIARQIKAFMSSRDGWLKLLVDNPRNITAAQHIVTINSKIELLESLWNWSDESIDMPH